MQYFSSLSMSFRTGVSVVSFLGMILILVLSSATGVGCNNNDSASSDSSETGTTAIAGSDSTSVDSTAVADESSKGGFFKKLFNKDGDNDDEDVEESVPVELATVVRMDMPAYLGTTATLESEKTATILAKITGEIVELHHEEGDWVVEGQVLALLDGAAQRTSVSEARARMLSIKVNLERAETLASQELTSAKELSDLRYQFEEAQAQLSGMQLQESYTRIIAPYSGQLAERFIDIGQSVSIGTQLFSIVDRDPLLARIHLPEKEAMKIVSGQDVVISPDTNPDQDIHGAVLRVAPVVDPRTGTVKITCSVPGNSSILRPGSFVRVRVQTDLRINVMAIPKRALVPEGGDIYVYRAEADTVTKIPVITGLANHLLIEVTDGINVGDRIVEVGHGGLKTGALIREIGIDQTLTVAETDSGTLTP